MSFFLNFGNVQAADAELTNVQYVRELESFPHSARRAHIALYQGKKNAVAFLLEAEGADRSIPPSSRLILPCLTTTDHDFLLNFIGYYVNKSDNQRYHVFEFYHKLLSEMSAESFVDSEVLFITQNFYILMSSILEGLKRLYAAGYFHGDLTRDNICLKFKEEGCSTEIETVKLCGAVGQKMKPRAHGKNSDYSDLGHIVSSLLGDFKSFPEAQNFVERFRSMSDPMLQVFLRDPTLIMNDLVFWNHHKVINFVIDAGSAVNDTMDSIKKHNPCRDPPIKSSMQFLADIEGIPCTDWRRGWPRDMSINSTFYRDPNSSIQFLLAMRNTYGHRIENPDSVQVAFGEFPVSYMIAFRLRNRKFVTELLKLIRSNRGILKHIHALDCYILE